METENKNVEPPTIEQLTDLWTRLVTSLADTAGLHIAEINYLRERVKKLEKEIADGYEAQ